MLDTRRQTTESNVPEAPATRTPSTASAGGSLDAPTMAPPATRADALAGLLARAVVQRAVALPDVAVTVGGEPASRPAAVLQRVSAIEVNYSDPAPAPNTPIGIEIHGSFLADQTKIHQPAGVAGPFEARHIVPNALLIRALQSEFNGKPASHFFQHHAYQAAHPGGFRQAVKEVVLGELMWRNNRLNKDDASMGAMGNSWMPATTAWASHSNDHRNYWRGSKAENQDINHQVHSLRSRVDAQWVFGNDAAAVDVTSAAFTHYKNTTDADNAQWLSWEFDPPPGKSKAEYQMMGQTWANFTSDWFKNNPLARLRYCPSTYMASGDIPWQMAYQPTAINMNKYNTGT